MKRLNFYLIGLAFLLASCQKEAIIPESNPDPNPDIPTQNCFNKLDEKMWKEGNTTYLYGGKEDSMHFNISSWSLDECKLKNGNGREQFQALLEPIYTPINEVDNIKDSEKCIVLNTGEAIKVYPYVTMSFHEVINEHVGGHPVAVAYCILADFAVVYDTRICDEELTFAVSGYTYATEDVFNNIEAFILWDRETESLWWPLIDMGVSGAFNHVSIKKFDESIWETKEWKDIINEYPDAQVLETQNQEVPQENFKIDQSRIDC